jgi:hypothetical protein
MVQACVRLVLEGCISLRAASRVLKLVAEQFDLADLRIPHWTTIREWILRMGLDMLRRSLPQAEDWFWLVDHSVQIGTTKCLVILGVRECDLPFGNSKTARPLKFADMQLVSLVPMEAANKVTIDAELEVATRRTGVPKRIVSDHGADIKGAISLFQQRHPETEDGYDIKHKLACLLKPLFESDPRWKEFQHELGQCKFRLQQTGLACLTPPSQRSKSRYMNLAPLLKWGRRMLELLRRDKLPGDLDRLEFHRQLKWLLPFRDDLARWWNWHRTVGRTLKFLQKRGLQRGIAKRLAARLPTNDPLAAQIVEFVRTQSAELRLGERRPASTEVVESCFAKLKHLESLQAKNGFTRLVLGIGANLASRTQTAIHSALTQTRTQEVIAWVKNHLGPTLQSLRNHCYHLADAKQKPGEKLVTT